MLSLQNNLDTMVMAELELLVQAAKDVAKTRLDEKLTLVSSAEQDSIAEVSILEDVEDLEVSIQRDLPYYVEYGYRYLPEQTLYPLSPLRDIISEVQEPASAAEIMVF